MSAQPCRLGERRASLRASAACGAASAREAHAAPHEQAVSAQPCEEAPRWNTLEPLPGALDTAFQRGLLPLGARTFGRGPFPAGSSP
jgi:hypothetical protein